MLVAGSAWRPASRVIIPTIRPNHAQSLGSQSCFLATASGDSPKAANTNMMSTTLTPSTASTALQTVRVQWLSGPKSRAKMTAGTDAGALHQPQPGFCVLKNEP